MKVMVILCCILWSCTSCTFSFDEPEVCPYNVRLNYLRKPKSTDMVKQPTL